MLQFYISMTSIIILENVQQYLVIRSEITQLNTIWFSECFNWMLKKDLQFIYLAVKSDTQNAGVVILFGSIPDIISVKQYMTIIWRKSCIKDVIKCIIGMANYIDTKELERCLHRY